jgi:hypothetical protein
MSDDNDCPICYELIEETVNRSTTTCGHTFHTTCLISHACTLTPQDWSHVQPRRGVYRSCDKTCPCCRTDLLPSPPQPQDPSEQSNSPDLISEPEPEPEPPVYSAADFNENARLLYNNMLPIDTFDLFQAFLHGEYTNTATSEYSNLRQYGQLINNIERARFIMGYSSGSETETEITTQL